MNKVEYRDNNQRYYTYE